MKRIVVVAILSLNFGAQAVAGTVYEVVAKKGHVAIKRPLDTEWKPLKGKLIPLGSLIRTDLDSRIEVALTTDTGEGGKVQRKIRIIQPLITRFDEDLIRRMQTKAYPLKAIWEHGEEAKKQIKDSPLLSFASSFFRSIVTLDKTPDLPPIKDENPDEESVQIGGKFLPIEVLSPGDDTFYVLEGEAKISVMWSPPKDGLTYRVYVWPEDEPRTTSLLSQKETWYTLKMTKAGKYKLQIEDSTHQFRSKAIRLTVDRSLSVSSAKTRKAETNVVKLEFPVERAIFMSADPTFSQRFSWTDDRPLEQSERYRLTIKGQGQPPIERETKLSSEAVSLKKGQYTWYVEKITPRGVSASRPRELRIESSSLSQSISKSHGQTVIIDLK